MHVVVTIAGSDSSAGAGIQADLKTVAACGAYAACVVTSITAQTPDAVHASFVLPATLVRAQLDAAVDAFPVGAVKTGMLANVEIVECVAQALNALQPRHFVLDPVMVSESGSPLLAADAIDCLRRQLLPLASVVTPNRHEMQALTGVDVAGPDAAEAAGRRLLDLGCGAVLVKGGHFDRARGTDVLVTTAGCDRFATPELASRSTHGTGCTLSAAIATFLARGFELAEAIRAAKRYTTAAIRDGLVWGAPVGPTDHFFFLRRDTARWIDTLNLHDAREDSP